LGLSSESIDFTESPDPDFRVKKLLGRAAVQGGELILVGSSMGGYVVTVASKQLRPAGLFLMAPAFYLTGYQEQDPVPHAGKTVIVHGWRDEVVPPENAFRFSRLHSAELHLLQAGHALTEEMSLLEEIFATFLRSIIFKRQEGRTIKGAGKVSTTAGRSGTVERMQAGDLCPRCQNELYEITKGTRDAVLALRPVIHSVPMVYLKSDRETYVICPVCDPYGCGIETVEGFHLIDKQGNVRNIHQIHKEMC